MEDFIRLVCDITYSQKIKIAQMLQISQCANNNTEPLTSHTHTHTHIYIYLPIPLYEQDVTQGQFLAV